MNQYLLSRSQLSTKFPDVSLCPAITFRDFPCMWGTNASHQAITLLSTWESTSFRGLKLIDGVFLFCFFCIVSPFTCVFVAFSHSSRASWMNSLRTASLKTIGNITRTRRSTSNWFSPKTRCEEWSIRASSRSSSCRRPLTRAVSTHSLELAVFSFFFEFCGSPFA